MASVSDLQHAMIKYAKTLEEYKTRKIGMESFTDGLLFMAILRSATNFKMKYGELIQNCTKWTFKLSNLKKIVSQIEDYFEEQIKKGVKTKDIDLVEIAKNNSTEELLKLFELVIATLTEAPNKEDHINTIMSLDERSQTAFVYIIQSLLQNRILDKNQTKQDKMIQNLNHLQMENTLLRSEVESLLNENHHLDKQIQQLKHKQADYQEQLHKIRDQQIDKTQVQHQEPKQKQHLRNMIDNLKQKLISTVRESEIKIAGLKQQINVLQSKSLRYEQIQEQLEDYKRKYTETIQSYGKAKLWEREKNKLIRTIDQKQQMIKKLNAKLDQANELNYAMQQREVYTKMELQKRDVRFKQLEKEVKKRYGTTQSAGLLQIPSSSKSLQLSSSNAAVLSQQINQIDRQQIEELKNEIEQLKKKNRENERQNNKLKRTIEKTNNLENDKKKLQRLILDVSNEKREQVQILLTTTHDFYAETLRLKQILTSHGLKF